MKIVTNQENLHLTFTAELPAVLHCVVSLAAIQMLQRNEDRVTKSKI